MKTRFMACTAAVAVSVLTAQTVMAADYKIGICNYVDDASLNQIVENIQNQLKEIQEEKGCEIEVLYDNCNADAAVMDQIISNFMDGENVDLMIAVATPVAMAMQAATEDNQIPVVFSAVSDPVGAQLVDTMEAPGANLTGTSDYLDTASVMNLILAENPEAKRIGLLYDLGQDSSTGAVEAAKAFCDEHGLEYVEKTGTTNDEVLMAAQSLAAEQVDAVFTPTDNTIMTAELSIYEIFNEAGIPHYTGADSFALNGAFLGYGVDYAVLGQETAKMAARILLDGETAAEMAVMTFDNGIATINTETCEAIGRDLETVKAAFAPLCTEIKETVTAESFE